MSEASEDLNDLPKPAPPEADPSPGIPGYPLALYRGTTDDSRIVQNDVEAAAAAADGFVRLDDLPDAAPQVAEPDEPFTLIAGDPEADPFADERLGLEASILAGQAVIDDQKETIADLSAKLEVESASVAELKAIIAENGETVGRLMTERDELAKQVEALTAPPAPGTAGNSAAPEPASATVEAVDIPDGWRDLSWQELRSLAAKVSATPIKNADDATAAIEAEVTRRAALADALAS